MKQEKNHEDFVDVLILVTPHGNVFDESKEFALFRRMTTGHLDKFVGIEDKQDSLQNLDAFQKIFDTVKTKLSLKRKHDTQLNQIEAKQIKISVK